MYAILFSIKYVFQAVRIQQIWLADSEVLSFSTIYLPGEVAKKIIKFFLFKSDLNFESLVFTKHLLLFINKTLQ